MSLHLLGWREDQVSEDGLKPVPCSLQSISSQQLGCRGFRGSYRLPVATPTGQRQQAVVGETQPFPQGPGLLKTLPQKAATWVSGKVESFHEIQECLERNLSLTEAGTESLRALTQTRHSVTHP